MSKLPMDFVSDVYSADYVKGWVCTASHLLVWYDGEVHVWDIDAEGRVPIPVSSLDPAEHSAGIHHDIDLPIEFNSIYAQYAV